MLSEIDLSILLGPNREPLQCLQTVPRYEQSYIATSHSDITAMMNRLVHGDCIDVLTQLPDDSVDLVHTSPPYNIDRPYRGTSDRRSLRDYTLFLKEVIDELGRVVKPGKSVFWQTGYTQLDDAGIQTIDTLTAPFFESAGFRLWDRIIWNYFGAMAFKRKFTNRHETILWYWKPSRSGSPFFQLDPVRTVIKEMDPRNNFWGRNPGNVWAINRVAHGSTRQSSHIAVFPEALSERIIRACSQTDDLVLDPFAGSGTVAKVAHSLDRNWLSFELSEEYVRDADKRLGYQQRGELNTLASLMIKKAFDREDQKLGVLDIMDRFERILFAPELSECICTTESLINGVFPDGVAGEEISKNKLGAWREFAEIANAQDLGGEIEYALTEAFGNREHQTYPLRYATAMGLVEVLRSYWHDLTGKEQYVEELLESEWSTYESITPSMFMLRSREPRIRWEEHPERTLFPEVSGECLKHLVTDPKTLRELQEKIKDHAAALRTNEEIASLFDLTLFSSLRESLSPDALALLRRLLAGIEELAPQYPSKKPVDTMQVITQL
ncbi:MAG: site-specific DNA-methyltransferase [Armatimonadetes bacterium]|nr:site-specific DNA-methyltransferase [Armatimonadota bacterium]